MTKDEGYLSEVARRRIAALILIVGILVAALAIGDVGPFSDPPTEAELAQDAVEQFFDAAHDHDFGAVCSLLTQEKRQEVEAQGARLSAEKGLKGCNEILAALAGKTLAETRITKFDSARVSGPQAAVDVELSFSEDKRPQPRTFTLLLVDGEWKINDFGL